MTLNAEGVGLAWRKCSGTSIGQLRKYLHAKSMYSECYTRGCLCLSFHLLSCLHLFRLSADGVGSGTLLAAK